MIRNGKRIIFDKYDEERIIDLYVNNKLSTVEIGKMYDVYHKTIARVLEKNNIKRVHNGVRKYNLDECYFDKIDNQNKAYILGFLYADGCNIINRGTISMALQEDDFEILEKIRNELKSEKELEFIDYSNKHDFGYTYKNQYRLLLFSKHMCNILNNIGMSPSKSLSIQFPDIDESLYRHFIRGYYDGDGSISGKYINENNFRIICSITSTFDFCNKISEILYKELDIYAGIYDASNHNGITKVISITKTATKKFLDWIYKDANLYMKRKYDRYIEYYYKKEIA